jgi:hypothetical protein
MCKLRAQAPDGGLYTNVSNRVRLLQPQGLQDVDSSRAVEVSDSNDGDVRNDENHPKHRLEQIHAQSHVKRHCHPHEDCASLPPQFNQAPLLHQPPLLLSSRTPDSIAPQIFKGVTAYINGFTGSTSGGSSLILSALHMQQVLRCMPLSARRFQTLRGKTKPISTNLSSDAAASRRKRHSTPSENDGHPCHCKQSVLEQNSEI